MTSPMKVNGYCGNTTLDPHKSYAMQILFHQNSNGSYKQSTREMKKSTGLDIFQSSQNTYSVLFTHPKTSKSKCIHQSLVASPEGDSVSFGNETCDVTKGIIVNSTNLSSMIALLGVNSNDEPQLNIYAVVHPIPEVSFQGTTHLVQSIPTYYASDVMSMKTNLGLFVVIANTYDSSPGSLTVSYTVPVVIYKWVS